MATTETQINRSIGKVRPHQTQNEGLVFEKSSPGKKAYKLPPLDDPRFTNPPNYPAKLLNQDSQPKDPDATDTPGHGLGSHGGGGSH